MRLQERFWQEVRQAVGTGMTGAGPRLMEVRCQLVVPLPRAALRVALAGL